MSIRECRRVAEAKVLKAACALLHLGTCFMEEQRGQNKRAAYNKNKSICCDSVVLKY